jgi:multidrug efflux pump subunit AcrB
MGLVTKNAILLIDRAIVRVREEGEAPLQAILQAGPERLRPILMTSAAMVLGMLPTALSSGEGSEFRAPMAIAVIGGVISSTLLSLVVVPVVYLSIENGKAGISRLRRWIRRKLGRADRPTAIAERPVIEAVRDAAE